MQTANHKGADQTARMHRLICAFVVRKSLPSNEGCTGITNDPRHEKTCLTPYANKKCEQQRAPFLFAAEIV